MENSVVGHTCRDVPKYLCYCHQLCTVVYFSGRSFSPFFVISNPLNAASNVCEVSLIYILLVYCRISLVAGLLLPHSTSPIHFPARLRYTCLERKLDQSESQFDGAIKWPALPKQLYSSGLGSECIFPVTCSKVGTVMGPLLLSCVY